MFDLYWKEGKLGMLFYLIFFNLGWKRRWVCVYCPKGVREVGYA